MVLLLYARFGNDRISTSIFVLRLRIITRDSLDIFRTANIQPTTRRNSRKFERISAIFRDNENRERKEIREMKKRIGARDEKRQQVLRIIFRDNNFSGAFSFGMAVSPDAP